MTAWHAHLQRHWFALALASEVRDRPVARMLMDQPVALARLHGEVAAFEDRCPHRQAPLSSGCIVDDALQCPYHGWRFERGGRLRGLPGIADDADLPAVSARAMNVREHDGLVWVQPMADDSQPLPGIATAQADSERRFLWSTTWQANIVDALENVLDATHTHYVHAGLVRSQAARRPMRAVMQTAADGFSVDYSGNQAQSGLIYRLFESRRERELARYAHAGSVQFEYGYRNGVYARISLHFAPETANRTRLHVAFHIRGRWAPGWAVRMVVWPFLRRVATQDARMLALQSMNRARFADRRDALGPLDIVRPALDAFWLEGKSTVADVRTFELLL